MTYREYTPPSSLSHIVECAWTSSDSPEGVAHSVLPDGAMDVIASLYPDGDVAHIWVVGAMTRPLHTTSNGLDLVALRFLPGAGGSALRANASELRDQSVALSCVTRNADHLRTLFRELGRAPQQSNSFARFTQIFRGPRSDAPFAIREAAQRFAQHPKNTSVEQVAKQVGLSRQHLARLFAQHVGLTPKQFARVCRVRAMLSTTYSSNVSWSQLAHAWGFTDQSHLIADVQSVVGKSPVEWLREAKSAPAITPVPFPQR